MMKALKNRHRKILEYKDLVRLNQKIHTKNQKIVFTTGSFELITPGHCRFLAEAKALGDILVVGVCSDRSITKIKGPDFPLLNQSARMEMLSYLRSVDYVTTIDEGEPHTAIVLLEPNIFYASQRELDNGNFDEQASYLLKKYKGKLVVRQDDRPYKSAYNLAEHIAHVRFIEVVASYLWSKSINFGLNTIADFKPADFGPQEPNDPKAFNPSNMIYKNPLELVEVRGALGVSGKKKLVFVSGSYDLLHVGHTRFLEKASTLGDILVVGIPSDSAISSKKGYGRPIISEFSRAYVLASLDFVDRVYIFDEETVSATLEVLKPDIFFTVDEEWNRGVKQSREYKIVKSYGGKVVLVPRQSPFVSSSTIINKIAYKKVKEIFSECLQDDKFKAMLLENGKNG
jgi:rfaE bifunctional protein nucleotidyltransferase chain/domain